MCQGVILHLLLIKTVKPIIGECSHLVLPEITKNQRFSRYLKWEHWPQNYSLLLVNPFVPNAPFLMFSGGRKRVHWQQMR